MSLCLTLFPDYQKTYRISIQVISFDHFSITFPFDQFSPLYFHAAALNHYAYRGIALTAKIEIDVGLITSKQ